MTVPRQINGMTVIEHGTFAAPMTPCGFLPAEKGPPGQPVRHVAICRAPDRHGFYTVLCTGDWNYVTSEFNETLLSARSTPHREFNEDVDWQLSGYSVVRFLSVAQRYIVTSIIASIVLVAIRFVLGPWVILDIAGLLIGTTFIVSALSIWILVAYVATKSGGWLYGLTHFTLVVLLTPVFLVGLFVIPSLVLGDLSRWHDWEESQENPNTTSTAP